MMMLRRRRGRRVMRVMMMYQYRVVIKMLIAPIWGCNYVPTVL